MKEHRITHKKYIVVKDGFKIDTKKLNSKIKFKNGLLTKDMIEDSTKHVLVIGDIWINCIDENGVEYMYCESGVMAGSNSINLFDHEDWRSDLLVHNYMQLKRSLPEINIAPS